MFIAQELRKKSIAEYLLYMWQIEDLIRANGLDIDKIQENIIDRYAGLSDQQRKEMREWYESLIDRMRREGVEKSGHLQLNRNTLSDLEDLHRRLLKDPRYSKYSAAFYDVLPIIVELRAKSGDKAADEIETCFNFLYGILMLRLQQKEISAYTSEALKRVTKFLATLAAYYKKDYNNELEFSE